MLQSRNREIDEDIIKLENEVSSALPVPPA